MNGKTPVGLQRSSFTSAGEIKIVYFIAKAECLQPEEVLEVGENSTCKRVLIDHRGNLLLRPLERTNEPSRLPVKSFSVCEFSLSIISSALVLPEKAENTSNNVDQRI